MSAVEGGKPRGRSVPQWALLGAAVSTGWVLNDILVFLTAGNPMVTLAILPGSLVAIAIGALVGALAGLFPPTLVLVALLATASVMARATTIDLLGLRGPFFLVIVAKMTMAWTVAYVLVLLLRRFLKVGVVIPGVCVGLLACLAYARLRNGEMSFHAMPIGFGALGCLVLTSIKPLKPLLRVIGCGLVLLWPAYRVGLEHNGLSRISWFGRPDLAPGPPPPAGVDQPNLILIVLDTVRADHMSSYGYERETSPNIDAWAREHATRYAESRSTSSYTLSSHASLFTGLFPAEHGAARLRPTALPLKDDVTTIAERLRERGYHTAAVAANGTYLTHKLGTDRGFERFDNRKGSYVLSYIPMAQATGRTMWAGHLTYRDARTITAEALTWLDEERREGPFFLMMNFLDAHKPYIPPHPQSQAFSDEQPAFPLTPEPQFRALQYDRNLLYLDEQVGLFLDDLEQRGLFENTVIVITSDHGEAFGEHGLQEHCWTLYEEVVNVPLFVKPAGEREVEVDQTPINGADVHWLMLRELGIDAPRPSTLEGIFGEWYRQIPLTVKYSSIADRRKHDFDQDLIGWIEDGRKFIVSTTEQVEVYDLAQDPLEQNPLEISEEVRRAALLKAGAWWFENPVTTGESEELDEAEMERLRALGYMGDDEADDEGDAE